MIEERCWRTPTRDYGGRWWREGEEDFDDANFSLPFLHTSTYFVVGLFRFLSTTKKRTFFNNWWNVILFSCLTDWKTSCIIIFSNEEKERERK